MVVSSMVDQGHQRQLQHKNNSRQVVETVTAENAVISESDQQQQQEELYYVQLLAVQQQAIAMREEQQQQQTVDGTDKNAREEREKREREGSERNTNLIINYLPQNMTQEEVRALFGSMGEVESCKLIRDKTTGQSLGYAFVNYERPEDARKALTSMNGLRLQNKVLKVSLARPSKDDIKGANLYVSGLPKSLTQYELEAVFRPFGTIITSRILSDNVTGLSKGVGFVRFDRKNEAELAIEKMSGSSPWGGEETVTVKFANSPSANSAKSTAVQMAQAILPLQMLQSVSSASVTPSAFSLPVGTSLLQGLSTPTQQSVAGGPIHGHTPQHRFRYSPLAGAPLISCAASSMLPSASAPSAVSAVPALSSFAPVISSGATTLAQIGADYYSAAAFQQQILQQQLTAFAAANPALTMAAAQQQQYAAQAAALAAAAAANSTIGQQSAVATQPNASTSPSAGGWTLSLHNLGSDIGEPALWRLFGPFGAVLSVKLSKAKGQAAVNMANYEEAILAANSLNGMHLGGRPLQIALKSTGLLPSLAFSAATAPVRPPVQWALLAASLPPFSGTQQTASCIPSGVWGDWGNWSSCVSALNIQRRIRPCNASPAGCASTSPFNCSGSYSEVRSCGGEANDVGAPSLGNLWNAQMMQSININRQHPTDVAFPPGSFSAGMVQAMNINDTFG
uniref:ELAV-like protein 2 n=1 Tax=Globodera pallida TaxID=36090 RepID=A0A183C955_GLOPA